MDAVRAIRAEFTMDRARAAARSGDLDEALRLLRDLDAAGAADAAALDLLARVHAQRGEFTEADACWSRLQTDAREYTGAEAGRQTIAEISADRRPALTPLRPARIALLAVPLALALVAGTVVRLGPGTIASAPVSGSMASRLRHQTERADALDQRLRVIDDQRERAATERARILNGAERGLAMSGVRIRRDDESLSVIFTIGLFPPNGIGLTLHGTALLDRVGAHLPRLNVEITVIGHTVAVPGASSRGGSAVAMARALAAAQRLAVAGHLPLTTFTLASADQRDRPYPDDSRDRTVTLQVTPLVPSPP